MFSFKLGGLNGVYGQNLSPRLEMSKTREHRIKVRWVKFLDVQDILFHTECQVSGMRYQAGGGVVYNSGV